MADPLITAVNRLSHRRDHRIGPLSRRLANDPAALDEYLDQLDAAMDEWRSLGIGAVEGGSATGVRLAGLLRPYTTLFASMAIGPVIAKALEVSPEEWVQGNREQTPQRLRAEVTGQWSVRKRPDVSDVVFEHLLLRHLQAATHDGVADFTRTPTGLRAARSAAQLLSLRGQLITNNARSRLGPHYQSLGSHVGVGLQTAVVHMVAELSLITRMPRSADRTPGELWAVARRSSSIVRKYASLPLSRLGAAASATSQLATAPTLARHQGFELQPEHFVDGPSGVRLRSKLDDYSFLHGDVRRQVADVPSPDPHTQCPVVHARIAHEEGGDEIALDALWAFTVDAYAEAGLFDRKVRQRLNEELSWLNSGQHAYRPYMPYSTPEVRGVERTLD